MTAQQALCFICTKPGRFTVREEGDPESHTLCTPCYRLAIGLSKLLREDS